MNKYAPGIYTITLFTRIGRKRVKVWLRDNLMDSQAIANKWTRRTGGTAVVTRCLYNTAYARPADPYSKLKVK